MIAKRGQFFLVAALVISGILIGLAGVYTQVNAPKEDTSVYDLSSELNFESLQVIDNGVYSDLSNAQLFSNVVNLTDYYAAKNPTKEFIVFYGNEDSIMLRKYSPKDVGSVGVGTGGGVVQNTISTGSTEDVVLSTGREVLGSTICLEFRNGQNYCVNNTLGKSFASVITFNQNNETYVSNGGTTGTGITSKTNADKDANSERTCEGTMPAGVGVVTGASTYTRTQGSVIITVWTYQSVYTANGQPSSTLGPCKWTCNNGFERKLLTNSCRERGNG